MNARAALPSVRAAFVACVASRSARAAFLACALIAACGTAGFGASTSGQDPPRRDEFGLVPEDATDKDLSLPDPVLDRTWPGLRPGEGAAPPPAVAPDEDETDPFEDETAPPPAKKMPRADEAEEEPAPRRPAPPLIGPDGRRDGGSPMAQPDPDLPDVLERDVPEPSEIEKEESRPSPLDRDIDDDDQEMGDPYEEW